MKDELLYITQSLHDFLLILLESGNYEDQWFWADQISMDQRYIEERNHQVNLMGDIYAKAQCVFAWLGQPLRNGMLDTSVYAPRASWDSIDPSNRCTILTLLDISAREYWSRLWIVQELLLAQKKRIWCGKYAVDSQHLLWSFEEIQRLLGSDRWPSPDCFPSQEQDRYRTQAQAFIGQRGDIICSLLGQRSQIPSSSLHYNLSLYGGLDCADPRDQIFGLQTLVAARERANVDYALSLEEVMYHAARIVIQSSSFFSTHHKEVGDETKFEFHHVLPKLLSDFLETHEYIGMRPDALYWAWNIHRSLTKLDVRQPWYMTRLYVGRTFKMASTVAATPKQKLLVEDLLRGFDTAEAEAARGGFIYEERWAYDEVTLQRGAVEVQNIIMIFEKVWLRHGFFPFDNFLVHPEEWPFDSKASTVDLVFPRIRMATSADVRTAGELI